MGMYNEVLVKCPCCDRLLVLQTKWGSCALVHNSLDTAPLAEIAELNEEGIKLCNACGSEYRIAVSFVAKAVLVTDNEEQYRRLV